jgi:hypothetical protein
VEKIEPSQIDEFDTLASKKFRRSKVRAAFVVGLTTNFGNAHRVLVVVPHSYPLKAPAVYALTQIRGQYNIAHIYGDDGRCCLFEKYGRDWDRNCDLVTIVSWAAMWLFCQEFFQRYGRWPAPESHKSVPRRRSKPWDARRRRELQPQFLFQDVCVLHIRQQPERVALLVITRRPA